MSDCDDLLSLARRNPRGLRFKEALTLAECWGFRQRRSKGGTSHCVYKRDGFFGLLNFQPDKNGMAKRFQVDQLVKAIDQLIEEGVS